MGNFGILLTLTCFIVSVTSQIGSDDCISPDDPRGLTCSGQGDCVMGQCQCDIRRSGSNEKFTGKYCECDDYSCPYDNQHICGGNGRCVCGVCECYDGYGGPKCEPGDYETCIASNGKVCNGTGVCETGGICKCHSKSPTVGPTCEEVCLYCDNKCEAVRDCAECVAFKTGPYDENTCNKKCKYVTIVDKLPGIQPGERIRETCQVLDRKHGCRLSFAHVYTRKLQLKVEVVDKLSTDCYEPTTKSISTACYHCLSFMLGVFSCLIVPWI